jgi:hypothetical protein
MTDGEDPEQPPQQNRRHLFEKSLEEGLARLGAAMPPAPTGRVRSLDEARSALRIPTSPELDILQTWGVPADSQLVAYPIEDPDAPGRVIEFALLRVVERTGDKVLVHDRSARLRLAQLPDALWVVYGSIATSASGELLLETINIAPAFTGQLSLQGETAHGITGQLLRLVSPPTIVAACAERLLHEGRWLEQLERGGGPAMSVKQRQHLERIELGLPKNPRVTDGWLAQFATDYLTLYHQGTRNIRAHLADSYDLTPNQVRDRTNQARKRGYLSPGARGRTGAQPGPRLLERGWRPPRSKGVVDSDNESDDGPDTPHDPQGGARTA